MVIKRFTFFKKCCKMKSFGKIIGGSPGFNRINPRNFSVKDILHHFAKKTKQKIKKGG